MTTGAVLYSSVGHGGASAYIAILALYGIAPMEIKPVALLPNILVYGVSFVLAGNAHNYSNGYTVQQLLALCD